jgi:glycosyltransferase involved in cell wall biosynthesis
MARRPLVSIGLPVFNGENFLREALDSLLAQTLGDFELIICDNASTDATRAISEEYAARDGRVRYLRQRENLGAARNHNVAFHESRGVLFKWAAHDDVCAPRFLEACVAALRRDRGAVLAATRSVPLGPDGPIHVLYEFPMRLGSARAHERFRDLICVEHPCTLAFGVIRRAALERTPLMGSYVGSDRNLVAELGLLGRLVEVDEPLFFNRQHALRSMVAFADPRRRRVWFDPAKDGLLHLPTWRTMVEYGRSVARVPMDRATRVRCVGAITEWAVAHRRELFRDVEGAVRDLAAAAGLARPRHTGWEARLADARRELLALAPPGTTVLLVDDNLWELTGTVEDRRFLPFLERDGQYFGTPPDAETAVHELERMRRDLGAQLVAFPWHATWWLDHFPGLDRHLRTTYARRRTSRRLVVFDLAAPLGAASQRPA